jgi:hypothetical protein
VYKLIINQYDIVVSGCIACDGEGNTVLVRLGLFWFVVNLRLHYEKQMRGVRDGEHYRPRYAK